MMKFKEMQSKVNEVKGKVLPVLINAYNVMVDTIVIMIAALVGFDNIEGVEVVGNAFAAAAVFAIIAEVINLIGKRYMRKVPRSGFVIALATGVTVVYAVQFAMIPLLGIGYEFASPVQAIAACVGVMEVAQTVSEQAEK